MQKRKKKSYWGGAQWGRSSLSSLLSTGFWLSLSSTCPHLPPPSCHLFPQHPKDEKSSFKSWIWSLALWIEPGPPVFLCITVETFAQVFFLNPRYTQNLQGTFKNHSHWGPTLDRLNQNLWIWSLGVRLFILPQMILTCSHQRTPPSSRIPKATDSCPQNPVIFTAHVLWFS